MLYNFAADSFYVMKLCSRLFVLHCRSRPKYDTSMHFDPHFEEVRGGVEPYWMARWKARAEFLLSVIERLSLSLTVETLQGKTCQNSQPSGIGRSLLAKISGGRGRPWGIFFGFYKTRHILLSNGENCIVQAPTFLFFSLAAISPSLSLPSLFSFPSSLPFPLSATRRLRQIHLRLDVM